jgi:hypothetical protein
MMTFGMPWRPMPKASWTVVSTRTIMKRNPFRYLILIVMFGLLLPPSPVMGAQNAMLTNIIVTNTRDDLLLYLTVKNAFSPEIEDTIQRGVPATFSFYLNLYRVRTFWPDKAITTVKVTHTLKFDILRKEYTVTRSWDGNAPQAFKSLQEAEKRMTELDSLSIVALERLEPGKRYQIRAKAKLDKLTLPFYLHYVLFFVSLWDFETDWYTIDFIY